MVTLNAGRSLQICEKKEMSPFKPLAVFHFMTH
jgi:hypothetical protein